MMKTRLYSIIASFVLLPGALAAQVPDTVPAPPAPDSLAAVPDTLAVPITDAIPLAQAGPPAPASVPGRDSAGPGGAARARAAPEARPLEIPARVRLQRLARQHGPDHALDRVLDRAQGEGALRAGVVDVVPLR